MNGSELSPALAVPAKLANVPPFPSVATKLLSLLSREDSSLGEIAACIGTDPALAGSFLKRANAADQALYCEVSSVLQAVSALGVEGTHELALTAATSGYAQSAIQVEVLRPCWNHTLACALAASEIARLCGFRPGEIYTAALLHDIGRLGLLTAYPSEYEAILMEAAGDPAQLLELEQGRFGVDHRQAGEWLARQWNLPESIVEAIAHHGETPHKPLTRITVVQIATRLADLLGFSVLPLEKLPELDEIAAPLPDSVRAQLKGQLPHLRERISRELRLSEAVEEPADAESQPMADAIPVQDLAKAPVEYSRGLSIAALALALVGLGGAVAFLLTR